MVKQPLSKKKRTCIDYLKDWQYRPISAMMKDHYLGDGFVMVFSSPENVSGNFPSLVRFFNFKLSLSHNTAFAAA